VIGWRNALSVTFIPATILLCVLPWAPESPRFLYSRGKHEECRKVLARLYDREMTAEGQAQLFEKAGVAILTYHLSSDNRTD
jgi:hypothetical protein